MSSEWGPLAGLIGTWEGDGGLDVAYANARQAVHETPYRERCTFSPFGPVDNGRQCLYGLDYRMSAWRAGETDPFHTEVGYWLWDASTETVMRCFMVPRGSTILAGGRASADATNFDVEATVGSVTFGILSNPYLDEMARTVAYKASISVVGDTFSYDQTTVVDLRALNDPNFQHTDRNTLTRVS